MDIVNTHGVIQVPIESFRPHPNNPRCELDEETIADLARDMTERGYNESHPLTVRKSPTDPDAYEIISGHHRCEAAKRAGLETVPARVEAFENDAAAFLAVLAENVQKGLSRLDRARGAYFAVKIYGMKQAEYAKKCGINKGTLSRMIKGYAVFDLVSRDLSFTSETLAWCNSNDIASHFEVIGDAPKACWQLMFDHLRNAPGGRIPVRKTLEDRVPLLREIEDAFPEWWPEGLAAFVEDRYSPWM